jgi:hypothetical protein
MAKFTQVAVLSIGTLAGAAVGFYALEAYKVKEKVRSKVTISRFFPHLASSPKVNPIM